jgi:hypothetical protein
MNNDYVNSDYMKTLLEMYKDVEGHEMWDQKIKYDSKERAKMILDTLDEEPELQREFNLQLRQRKLNKIKK